MPQASGSFYIRKYVFFNIRNLPAEFDEQEEESLVINRNNATGYGVTITKKISYLFIYISISLMK